MRWLDPAAADWPEALDRLRTALGAPTNPLLFPAHFLKATFPKIGGRTLRVESRSGRLLAGCFLFPREATDGRRTYTLRYHQTTNEPVDLATLCSKVEAVLGGDRVVFYNPAATQIYHRTSRIVEGIDIGTPDAAEAVAIRDLAREIWETESDGLYPADIASVGFHAGTALAARLDGRITGFLLGFVKFGGPPLPDAWRQFEHGIRLESQLLGVSPQARQHGLGTLLKRIQGEDAAAAGVEIVNWTVDPLQYGNAVLNLGRLRAVAFDFLPDYYPFRNALNRVPASRLAMTWLVRTARTQEALHTAKPAAVHDLAAMERTRRVNRGPAAPLLDADDPAIAIEIPAHWTALQRDDLPLAQAWRATTDRLFQTYLGRMLGSYMLTDVAIAGEQRFLIGRRIDAALLEQHGAPAAAVHE